MPAFNKRSYELIEGALNRLSERAINNHWSPDILPEQLYPMLVRPEHMQVLTEADSLAGPLQSHGSISIPFRIGDREPTITFTFSESLPRVLPPYIYKNGFHHQADPETYAKIKAWVERRIQIGRDWTEAKRLIHDLNEEVSNTRQIAFFCHGVVALMNQHDDLRRRVGTLGEFKVPGTIPGISREMRDAGIKATQTIARALLVSSDGVPARPVALRINPTTCGLIKMPWGNGQGSWYID